MSRRVRFCSTRCSGIGQRKPKIVKTCEACGNTYELYPSDVAKAELYGYRQRFCSRRCPARGKHVTSRGYIAVIVDKDDPMAVMQSGVGSRTSRYVFEHRLVMARKLGRPLLIHEEVHHVNGDKRDNRLSNLELWTRSHPRGQRAVDKLAWAKEIVALYGEQFGGTEEAPDA